MGSTVVTSSIFLLSILGITIFNVIYSAFLGIIRGRNRALLRLILVVLSIILAFLLKNKLVEVIMNLDIKGASFKETLLGLIGGEDAIPEKMLGLVLGLIEVAVSVLAFYSIFSVLLFVTWIIVFPICKIFIKKGIKVGRLLGLVFGIIQGAIMAFVFCAPITGLAINVNKLSKTQVDGEDMFVIPAEVGIETYCDSQVANFYYNAGGWFFDMLTTTKTEENGEVSIGDMTDAVVTIIGVIDKVSLLGEEISNITNGDTTPLSQKDSLDALGATLIEMGNILDEMSPEAKEIINNLVEIVKDVLKEQSEVEELPVEIETFLDSFNTNDIDLVAAGEALTSMSSCLEKTNPSLDNDQPITQEEVDKIITGLEKNPFILTVLSNNGVPQVLDVTGEEAQMFEDAIENSSLTDEEKDILRQMLISNY